MDLQQAHQIIGQLVAAWQSFRIYPAKHPSRAQRTKQCYEQLSLLLMHHSPLHIGLTEETLFIGDHLLTDPYIAETEATDILNDLKIKGIEIVRGLTLEELDLFFALSVYCIQSNKKIENATHLKKLHHLRIITLLEENEKPRAIYNAAMQAVEQVFKDIRGGRVPSTEGLRNISKSMVQSILRQKHAMFALAQIKDYDNYTFNHSVNVGIISLSVGHACMIDPQQLHLLAFGGMVHDIGKLKIPVEILNKPGSLNEAELNQIRMHPVNGRELISQVAGIQQEIIDMVHYHHLHYNRAGGYPKRPGRNLSPLINMVTIADHLRRNDHAPVLPAVDSTVRGHPVYENSPWNHPAPGVSQRFYLLPRGLSGGQPDPAQKCRDHAGHRFRRVRKPTFEVAPPVNRQRQAGP